MKAIPAHDRKTTAKVAITRSYTIHAQGDSDVLQRSSVSRVSGVNVMAPLPNPHAIPCGHG
jgi:hypothetical protein